MKLGKVTEKITNYGKLKESLIGEDKVSFWESTWKDGYDFISEGAEIEFDVVDKEKNGYMNHIAYPKKVATRGSFTPNKGNSYEKTQEMKDKGIKLSSSMNGAVSLAIAEYTQFPTADLSLLVKKWRKFIADNWEAPF